MKHPKEVGDDSTMTIMLALRRAGFRILLPFGENTRYDLVTDDGRALRKVQCKTGRLRAGAVVFATCSHYGHHPNPKDVRRDYLGQVDDFAVFCPALDAVYLIPIEDLPTTTHGTLRVDPPRNGQRKKIRFAAAYELARVDVY